LPTAQCLRSAVVVNGAFKIKSKKQKAKSKSKARRPCGRPVLAADLGSLWERACPRRRLYSRLTSVGMVGPPRRFFRRALAVAGWEGLSL